MKNGNEIVLSDKRREDLATKAYNIENKSMGISGIFQNKIPISILMVEDFNKRIDIKIKELQEFKKEVKISEMRNILYKLARNIDFKKESIIEVKNSYKSLLELCGGVTFSEYKTMLSKEITKEDLKSVRKLFIDLESNNRGLLYYVNIICSNLLFKFNNDLRESIIMLCSLEGIFYSIEMIGKDIIQLSRTRDEFIVTSRDSYEYCKNILEVYNVLAIKYKETLKNMEVVFYDLNQEA